MKKLFILILLLFLTSCKQKDIDPNEIRVHILNDKQEAYYLNPFPYDWIIDVYAVLDTNNETKVRYEVALYSDWGYGAFKIQCLDEEDKSFGSNPGLVGKQIFITNVDKDLCDGEATITHINPQTEESTSIGTIDFSETYDDLYN